MEQCFAEHSQWSAVAQIIALPIHNLAGSEIEAAIEAACNTEAVAELAVC